MSIATLVDSNVLIDVATDDPAWGDWSADHLARAAGAGPLVVNAVIFAEVSAGFERIEDLDALLAPPDFQRENLPYAAAFLAGKAFVAYRGRGGKRTAMLSDFLIGAHAAVRGYRLLTRDRGRYGTYFPTLEVVAPA